MTLVALDDRRAGGLVGADHLPQVFGVEPSRQRSGAREVAEHDGDLTALAVGPWLARVSVVGGSSLAHQPALRAGQARQPLAAAAAEHIVGVVQEGAARAGQRQCLAAGRAESAVDPVVDAAGRTFHVDECRVGQPAGQGRAWSSLSRVRSYRADWRKSKPFRPAGTNPTAVSSGADSRPGRRAAPRGPANPSSTGLRPGVRRPRRSRRGEARLLARSAK